MTLREALLISKKTGQSFARHGCEFGWAAWDEEWVYKFSAEDLIADDWMHVNEFIEEVTGGRWTGTEDPLCENER